MIVARNLAKFLNDDKYKDVLLEIFTFFLHFLSHSVALVLIVN